VSLPQFLREYFPYCSIPVQGLTSLTADSRKVTPGGLFAALPGTQDNGVSYIPQAIAAGAAMILIAQEDYAKLEQIEQLSGLNVQFLRTGDPRLVFAKMAAAFYEKRPKTCVAVTGTNGKSSVVDFTRQLWTLLGYQSASIGTLGVKGPMLQVCKGLTTPDPAELHTQLAQLATEYRVTHCALEASSHGLDQRRLDGLRFQAAAFTQFTQDHLDYHVTMEAYFQAKKYLFEELTDPKGTYVLNADVPEFSVLSSMATKRNLRVLDYGEKARALVLHCLVPDKKGQQMQVEILGRQEQWFFPLIGQFQAYNFLCTLGLVLASGTKAETLLNIFSKHRELPIQGVAGRLECVAQSEKTVYVDYAHTPDALAHVLSTIRAHTSGRILIVFGCGGNRDCPKRPLMGQVAERFGDYVFITDDNPRDEDPAKIRQDMRAGMKGCVPVVEIADRYEAIARAITEATSDDVVLIAGKGHEKTQLVRGVAHSFSDQAVVKEILRI
jgi:UDP-N-acetylmuramoyl-L-alanyl-D-glutamate--2,6-diaminopimelate ligase